MDKLFGYGDPKYTRCSGYWASSDSESHYKNNLITHRGDLELQGWLDFEKGIVYNYNNWGFRSREFNSPGGIMFLGCSHVTGVGLPEQDTFAHIVGKNIGLQVYNMGISGGSNDSSFRVADHWIPKLQPAYVFMLITHSVRLEIINDDNLYNIMIDSNNDYSNSSYYKDFICNDQNMYLSKKKNSLAVQHICLSNNIKFLKLDVIDELFKDAWRLDLARDLIHIGKKGNQMIANSILNMIESS